MMQSNAIKGRKISTSGLSSKAELRFKWSNETVVTMATVWHN